MRPLELTIEGFRSYAERTTFDFRERRLVAIVGPIGSGKSSLLDAIAFALYGRTPVFSRESHTLINQRLDRARVELLFEAEGELWRVVRVIRQRGASKHALYRYESADKARAGKAVENFEKAGVVAEHIESLLGLDFQGFCRSVLLAQGRFAEFLAAPRGERDKVLKGVFGFDRIDAMREQALERRAHAEREVARIEGQLSAARDVDERLAAARRAHDATRARAHELDAAAPEIAAIEADLAAAERAGEQASAEIERLGRVAAPLPARDEVIAICASTRDATQAAHDAARARDRARGALDRAREALARREQETGGEAALERARAAAGSLAERRQQADVLGARVAKLETDLARDDAARSELDAAREAATTQLARAQQRVDEHTTAADKAEAALAELRAGGADEHKLDQTARDLVALAHRCDDAARLAEELGAVGEAAQANAAARAEAERACQLAAADVTRAEAAHEVARERALERERALHAARGHEMAAALRETLQPGGRCPVCAQTVDAPPSHAPPAVVSAAEVALLDAREQLERQAALLAQARQALVRAEQTRSDLFDRAAEIGERHEETDARWAEARVRVETTEADLVARLQAAASDTPPAAASAVPNASDAPSPDADAWVAARAARRESLEEALAEARARLDAASEGARAAKEALLEARGAHRDAQAALTLCASRSQAAAEARERVCEALAQARGDAAETAVAIEKLEGALREQLGEGDPVERLAELRAALVEAAAGHQAAALALETAEQTRRAARDDLREAAKQRRRVEHKLDVAAARLELGEAARGAAHDAGAAASPQLELGLDGERDADAVDALDLAIRSRLEDLRGEHVGARAAAEQQATRAAARREERLRALGIGAPREGNEGDEGDEDDEHSATPLTLDGARGAARSALEAARVELERLESQAEAARALLGELSAASARVARAGQLADDLRADRFLRYLLDEERTALSQLGSARFEMLSGGRYRFTDDGEFRIVDLANAEQERKAETLSGGETFLASLALALALAERVSGAGGRGLDAFFLDEGFGTLDAEHLELALEGIERLVIDAPRRLVALVSHVPALRERIDDRIELDRDPLTGNTRVQRGASAPQPHAESFVAAVGRRLATAPTPASTRTP